MKTTVFLSLFLASGLAQAATNPDATAAQADIQKTFGFVPGFLKQLPESVQLGVWEEMKGLEMNPNTALPLKIKELVGLAVASQIPCEYCIAAHTEFAKANGATPQEIGEAVAMGAFTRHWSTFMNGIQLDENKFKSEIGKVVDTAKKMMAQPQPATPPAPMVLTDAASVYKDVEQSWGFVPDFVKQFPAEGVVGAWRQMRDVEMNPKTAIPNKYKSLIGLAVASQVPCKFCVTADTEFSKLEGATDRELKEAVAMAAFVREMSTMLNGLQVDKATFKGDLTRIIDSGKKAHAKR